MAGKDRAHTSLSSVGAKMEISNYLHCAAAALCVNTPTDNSGLHSYVAPYALCVDGALLSSQTGPLQPEPCPHVTHEACVDQMTQIFVQHGPDADKSSCLLSASDASCV